MKGKKLKLFKTHQNRVGVLFRNKYLLPFIQVVYKPSHSSSAHILIPVSYWTFFNSKFKNYGKGPYNITIYYWSSENRRASSSSNSLLNLSSPLQIFTYPARTRKRRRKCCYNFSLSSVPCCLKLDESGAESSEDDDPQHLACLASYFGKEESNV